MRYATKQGSGGQRCGVSSLARVWTGWVLMLALAGLVAGAEAAPQLTRVKDVATIEGIRDNQLVGYGLVVGLRGTGDSSQTVFPAQTLISALERMGITVPQTGSNSASNMQIKNMGCGLRGWPRCLHSAVRATKLTLPFPRLEMRGP